jgi:hypothetical protein
MGLVFNLAAYLTEPSISHAPIQTRLLSDLLAGFLCGSLRTLGHALHVQVFQTDHPESFGQVIG